MDVLYSSIFASCLFLIAGFLLLFLEVFIPSGGVLGIVSVALTGFGAFGLYMQGKSLLAVGVLILFGIYCAFIIRFIMKRISFQGSMNPRTSTSVDPRIEGNLIGQKGITVTALRPAGMATIKDQKVDVVSVGEFIDKNIPVSVVDISGNRIVVRPDNSEE